MNTRLPFMKRWPMQFWTDEDVAWLARQDQMAHLTYSALLDHMWINGGSIRDDDEAISNMLKIDLATWLRLRPFLLSVLISFADDDGVLRLTQKRLAADFKLAMQTLDNQREILAKGRDKANARKAKKAQQKSAARQEPEQEPVTGADDRAEPQAPAPPPPPLGPSTGAANAEHSRAEQKEKKEEPSSESVVAVERGFGGEKNATDKKATEDQVLKPKTLSDIANMGFGDGQGD